MTQRVQPPRKARKRRTVRCPPPMPNSRRTFRRRCAAYVMRCLPLADRVSRAVKIALDGLALGVATEVVAASMVARSLVVAR